MTLTGPRSWLEQAQEGPGSGVIAVTSFDCRTRRDMLVVWWMHRRLRPAVVANAPAFQSIELFWDWPNRRLRSVSLWDNLRGLYDMGEVREHVAAVRVPAARGIRTACAIFVSAGDWRNVMFGSTLETACPLQARQPPYPTEIEQRSS